MKNIIICLFTIATIGINAQSIERQVIATTGGIQVGSSIELSSTVGEPVVGEVSSGTIHLNQGYQQSSAQSNNTSVEEEIVLNYSLYPNPATDFVVVNLENKGAEENISLNLYSLEGVLVFSETLFIPQRGTTSTKIDISQLASGVYSLRVSNADTGNFETLQIIKQ